MADTIKSHHFGHFVSVAVNHDTGLGIIMTRTLGVPGWSPVVDASGEAILYDATSETEVKDLSRAAEALSRWLEDGNGQRA